MLSLKYATPAASKVLDPAKCSKLSVRSECRGSDYRFVLAIDEPLGLKSGPSPAREILAVPIVLSGEQTSQQYIDLPKAVLILINRVDCAPFSQEDNEYLCSYAPLIGRALDVVQ